jgi:hypothetical protein
LQADFVVTFLPQPVASDVQIEDRITLAYEAHVKDDEPGLQLSKLPDVLSVLGMESESLSLDVFREFALPDNMDVINLEGLKKVSVFIRATVWVRGREVFHVC